MALNMRIFKKRSHKPQTNLLHNYPHNNHLHHNQHHNNHLHYIQHNNNLLHTTSIPTTIYFQSAPQRPFTSWPVSQQPFIFNQHHNNCLNTTSIPTTIYFHPGHIATLFPVRVLYPEPRTRPYEICIYHHRSFALSVELPVGSGLQDPQQLLVRPAW